ncbi:D-lactate dehydrogenase, partial [Acinetobacter baumannii]
MIHRGPAFTQLALFGQLDASGSLSLVNHLGINLGNDPEAMLQKLEQGAYSDADIANDPNRVASDHDYATQVRDI